jgi:hypothetical protein
MLKYWFKILKTENCILKNCYEDMFESSVFKSNDKLNWDIYTYRNDILAILQKKKLPFINNICDSHT